MVPFLVATVFRVAFVVHWCSLRLQEGSLQLGRSHWQAFEACEAPGRQCSSEKERGLGTEAPAVVNGARRILNSKAAVLLVLRVLLNYSRYRLHLATLVWFRLRLPVCNCGAVR